MSGEAHAMQDRAGFRGASCYRTATSTKTYRGYTMTHKAVQDSYGRYVSNIKVTGDNDEWRDRCDRVYKGLAAVRDNVRAGVHVKHLEGIFRGYIDPSKDTLYGPVVMSAGFQGDGREHALGPTLEKHMVVACGAGVGAAGSQNRPAVFRTDTIAVQ